MLNVYFYDFSAKKTPFIEKSKNNLKYFSAPFLALRAFAFRQAIAL